MGERTAEDRKVEGSTPSRGIFMEENMLKKLSFADSFSILNGLFGLLSIATRNFLSLSFILLAVLADGMDGIIARKYGSRIAIIDEFADIVSFCIAPIIFIFNKYGKNIILISLSALYLIAGILHLINYHFSKKNYFIGITTPASAIIIATISFLSMHVYILFIATIILSFLMISPVLYPRIEKKFSFIATIIIFLAIFLGWKNEIFIYILLFATILYAIAGPLYIKIIQK